MAVTALTLAEFEVQGSDGLGAVAKALPERNAGFDHVSLDLLDLAGKAPVHQRAIWILHAHQVLVEGPEAHVFDHLRKGRCIIFVHGQAEPHLVWLGVDGNFQRTMCQM